jgi:hypothetical protein
MAFIYNHFVFIFSSRLIIVDGDGRSLSTFFSLAPIEGERLGAKPLQLGYRCIYRSILHKTVERLLILFCLFLTAAGHQIETGCVCEWGRRLGRHFVCRCRRQRRPPRHIGLFWAGGGVLFCLFLSDPDVKFTFRSLGRLIAFPHPKQRRP